MGHNLGLIHDGYAGGAYYPGHGSGVTGWAPIMGSSLGRSVSQWSKAEYANPSNPNQDDIIVISSANNDVAIRNDDIGATAATARKLTILTGSAVNAEGIIETAADYDAHSFTTTGGAVSLTINPASTYPNLDILAELVDANSGTVIASNNPDLALNASLSATVSAGSYLVRISGVGRADPLTTGYSDYASLGSYTITGTIAGTSVTPNFTVAENSPNGTTVGTVVALKNHGGGINFAITSGNENSLFAIHPTTGVITVANTSLLNFETYSSQWDDPATIDLEVQITGGSPANDELIRHVVTITNINEAPTVTPAAVTIMEHTRPGTRLVRVTGADVDPFDFPTFSITGGNAGNLFSIEPGSGYIKMAADLEITSDTVFTLNISVSDTATPAVTASTTAVITAIATPDDYEPGRIVRTSFDNIAGTDVSDLTSDTRFPNAPSSETFITALDARFYNKHDFGDTLRAHLMPPASGTYTFWLAAADAAELWLSTDSTQSNAILIASVTSPTSPHDWDAMPGQQSAPVTLVAGQPYWLEVRHKKGAVGEDHVSVAWQGSGIPVRQAVSGLYLSPVYQNYAPTITAAALIVRDNAIAGQTLGTVTTTDVNQQDTFGSYAIIGGDPAGAFGIDAATGRVFIAQSGLLNAATTPSYALTVSVTDNGTPPQANTATITVNVLPSTGVNATGILQQRWSATSLYDVSYLLALPSYPYQPTSVVNHTSYSTPQRTQNTYGSRIQSVLTPTVSGTYTFYMSADDTAEFWFSTNPSGTGATKLINIASATPYNNFTSLPTQASAPVVLAAGVSYYIQTLHTQGGNDDYVQVAWTGPGIPSPTVLSAGVLQPYDLNASPSFASAYNWSIPARTALDTVIGNIAATDPEADQITYGITSGNSSGTFAINSSTGVITVADIAAITPGNVFNLQVIAQDRGIEWTYPLRSTTTSLTVTVQLPNQPPVGPSSITKANASRGIPYSASLAADFSDPNVGDVLTFTKQSGPAWLIVGPSGALSGTPGVSDVGANSWTVQVADQDGLFIESTLNINVQSVNAAPVWPNHSLTTPAGTIGAAYASSVAADATDPDVGDVLTFSKTSGPAWLTVSANGTLSGTPALTDVGVNSWSVRVTDLGGLYDTATLQITVTAPPLGAPWASADVGSTGRSGATVTGGGVYNQAGAGVGVSGTTDAFQFASQSLTGNGEIRVRLASLGGTAQASAGVMLRDGTAAGAKTAFLGVKAGNIIFATRTSTGGSANVATVAAANPEPNNWLRLTRSSGILTAYRSADGTTWTTAGTVTLTSITTLQVGIATSSADTSNLGTASFDNLQVTPFPSQWVSQQIGSVTAAGRAEYFDGAYTLNGSGIIRGSSDSYYFTQQTMSGDGNITVRLTTMQNTGTNARAGIMITDSSATGAKRALLGISPDGAVRFQYRTKVNAAETVVTGGTSTLPNVWLRLVRSGTTINAYKSSDGSTWTLVTSKTVSLSTAVLCGIATSSGSTTTLNASTADNVVFTP